ncbi:MAG: class D sortase [Chloroflexi bacterium]|nr:MAG: class D sortase [Chloroflexota bacterium]
MRDKRPVDELSIEELERILAIRKREERMKRLKRMERQGRVIPASEPPPAVAEPAPTPATPRQLDSATLVSRTVTLPEASLGEKRPAAPMFEDDADIDIARPRSQKQKQIWRRFVDRALLAVELLAVAGLVFLGVKMVEDIGRLERETASAQAQAEEIRRAGIPTPTATPQLEISQFVLPSGHTPPTSPDGGQFNFNEVPEHLRNLAYQQIVQPPISRPAPTDDTPIALIIPKLNINHTIVQGVDWQALQQGIGMVPNGAKPSSDEGNIVLAAHNDIYGELFRYLDQLSPGDKFQIQTRTGVYTYTITGTQIVEPTAVEVMEHTERPTATLISCYPYQVDNMRIVVKAERDDL